MKKILIATLLSVGLLLLGGCSRGPDAGNLQRDLQTRLDRSFGEGLLQIQNFRRYGSQPLSRQEGDNGDRLAIYYRAELALLRDHHFSDWNGQNVGALHQLLGSAEQGIEGVSASGNQVGDTLSVHGFSVYINSADGWITVPLKAGQLNAGGVKEKPGIVAEIDSGDTAREALGISWQSDIASQLQSITAAMDNNGMVGESAALRSTLQAVLTRAKLEVLQQSAQTALLSGAETGNYHALAQGLEKILPSLDTGVAVVPSSGAIENINLLRSGLATFAFTQSDLAVAAYNGSGVFAGRPAENLRAVAALYPEPVQIVVRSKSDINTLADLAGKQVNIGADGTGPSSSSLLACSSIDPRMS